MNISFSPCVIPARPRPHTSWIRVINDGVVPKYTAPLGVALSEYMINYRNNPSREWCAETIDTVYGDLISMIKSADNELPKVKNTNA